jgi:phosphatidylglycerol---prolipoprotein diacylglyceryl transferase
VHPILFRIGSYEVASYGVALLAAFGLGIAVAHRRALARGLSGERILDVSMLILVTSLVGARLLWVVTHPQFFRPPYGSWLDAVNPFQADGSFGIVGLSQMGGVALAVISTLVFFAFYRLPILPYADVLAPSVLLGEGITRIGCFLNGCCFGLVCDWPWAVHFPEGSPARALFGDRGVHPTQLYTSALGFAGFALLLALARRRPRDGVVFCAFLVYAGSYRIALDFVRYYEPEVIVLRAGGLAFTVNQVICLALVVAGVAGLLVLRRARGAGQRAEEEPARARRGKAARSPAR